MQWNGSAENGNDIERLGRNVGEVLGVFAQTQFRASSLLEIPRPARTSARRLHQARLENHLKTLWSPEWPEHIGKIDAAKKEAGRILYQSNCVRCHEIVRHGLQTIQLLKTNGGTSTAASAPPSLKYKAAPLAGIWATAPYLHNGSVPNLYELLHSAQERPKTFFVGSSQFDPEKVGFRTEQALGTTLFDTSKPGNSNAGHDMYGDFSEEERWQLVEYLKSL